MSEQSPETKSFDLPITGGKVEIRAWLSGRDDDEIQRIVRGGVDYEMEVDVPTSKEAAEELKKNQPKTQKGKARMNTVADLDAEQRAIELMVVSLNGDTDNILDRVLDLPAGDTNFVKEKINEITEASGISPKGGSA